MRKSILAGLICLSAGLFLAAAGSYKPLDVKTGLWETTSTTSMNGAPPIPPEVMQRMTPEQRERFKAMIDKMGKGQTRTYKNCLTKEKLERNPFSQTKESCTQTIVTSTGSKMEVHEVCNNPDSKVDLTVNIEASDSEHVTGTIKSNVTGSGHNMNINGTFKSKWLGAACGDVK